MRTKDLNKVSKIYTSALQLVLNEGFAGLTMSKIAKKAGIATGTTYIYFDSKEDLINQLYLDLREKSNKRFMYNINPDEDFETSFKKVWLNYLKHRIEHYKESVFLEHYYRSPFITKKQKDLAESMKYPVHDIIQKGKDLNIFKTDYDNEMMFVSVLGFIRGLVDEHVINVYKLDKDRIEQAFQLSWESLTF